MEGATLNNGKKPIATSSPQPLFPGYGGTADPTTPSAGKGDFFETSEQEVHEDDTSTGRRKRTVSQRLEKTLAVAKAEQEKYARRANLAALFLNFAMFSQIVVNALVTGLSAIPNNRHAQIGVSALGAIGTVLASFIVRVRGTREPERSGSHAQNLDKYIHELESFILDEGHSTHRKWDWNVKEFRLELDHLQTAVQQSENGHPMRAKPPSKLGDAQTSV